MYIIYYAPEVVGHPALLVLALSGGGLWEEGYVEMFFVGGRGFAPLPYFLFGRRKKKVLSYDCDDDYCCC